MDLCFYPSELSEESRQTIIRMRPTAGEQAAQWNSKIVLVARFGKGFVGMDVPVMIKEIAFFGKLRVQLELMQEMPLLRQVQLSFLETPKIDFVLRPLKAFDLMDLPGLSNWMMSMINDNLEAQLVNPNRITINIAGSIEKIRTGVLKVKIVRTQGITFAHDMEPFIRLELNGKSRGKTAKVSAGEPVHGRFFILTRALTKPLLFHVMGSNSVQLGTASFPLTSLIADNEVTGQAADVLNEHGEVLGQVVFNLLYVTAEDVLDPEADLNSETGVFSMTLQRGERLVPVGKDGCRVYGEAWVHPMKLDFDPAAYTYSEADPTCHRFATVATEQGGPVVWAAEPEWEVYLDKSGKTAVTLLVRDAETDEIYCRWTGQVKQLLNRSDWFHTASGDGRLSLAFGYRPTASGGAGSEQAISVPSMGILRLRVLGASGMDAKRSHYAVVESNETEIGRTARSLETANPVFHKTIITPLVHEQAVLNIEVYSHDLFKDRMAGELFIPAAYALEHPNEMVQAEEPLLDKQGEPLTSGEKLRYEIGFYPIATTAERSTLEDSAEAFPVLPEDAPAGSNCAIFAAEQLQVRGLQAGKGLFAEIALEDADEPLVLTAPGNEVFEEGVFTWKFYAETFVKEPRAEEIIIRLKENRVIGGSEVHATLQLALKEMQSGVWYKAGKAGIEFRLRATCKPLALTVPTEAENVGVLTVNLQSAASLLAVDSGETSDPFAVFRLNNTKVYKSEVVKKELNPEWNETFETAIMHRDRDTLNIDFRDWNRVAVSRTLGQVGIDLSTLPVGKWADYDLPLENTSTGTVKLRLKFEQKGLGRKIGAAVAAAPGAAIAGVASGVGTLAGGVGHGVGTVASGVGHGVGSLAGGVGSVASGMGHGVKGIGNKMFGRDKDKDRADDDDRSSMQQEKASKVGGLFGGIIGRRNSSKDSIKQTSPPTSPVVAAGPADGEEPVLCITFLELRVSGVAKPFDTRIKVKHGDKTIFKSDEIKSSITPSFRDRPAEGTTCLLPPVDPGSPAISFHLNWSAKSEPSTPECVFNPETMNVIEELDDSAIASIPFAIRGGVTAEIVFKFAEADTRLVESLRKGSIGKMFSKLM